jgi:uncharacterized membrane protein
MAVSPAPPGAALDRTFRLSIALKGLDGILEIIGGALLLFISPSAIHGVARVLTQHELSEDPRDFFTSWLLHAADSLTVSASLFGAIYLLAHGLVKVVLVVAVLRNRLWAYPWMIAFLLACIVYQLYRMAVHFSVGLLLTIFDVFVTWLTWVEYGRRRGSRTGPGPHGVA